MKFFSYTLVFIIISACAKAPRTPEKCSFVEDSDNYFSIQNNDDSPGRYDEISHEWKANTSALLESIDPSIFDLLTSPQFKLPLILPDGKYKQ